MTENLRCSWHECKNEVGPNLRIDGDPYCHDHYRQVIERSFVDAYDEWDGSAEPGRHFRYWFARYFESLIERKELALPALMTGARIRDRGYEFKKTESGPEFSIIRHRYAWSEIKIPYDEKERWGFDIEAKKARVMSPRDSIQNDKVICFECWAEMKQITSKHLVSHGMNLKEYKRKYNFTARTPLAAKSLTKARSEAAKERGLPEKLQKYMEERRQEKAEAKAEAKTPPE
jgi:hypothetical protein